MPTNLMDAIEPAILAPVRNSERPEHPRYRADIDGLRAIAVLSVVGFHAFPYWVHGGFIGVDIFFVISGFLISRIILASLEQKRFSFVEFYSRRIRRIFPALLLVLLASLAFGWFTLLADEYAQLGKHIAGGAGFTSNFLLWNESGYFDNSAGTKPLLHLWSLSIEEQFYIVWPLMLWIMRNQRFNLLRIALFAAALITFLFNVIQIHIDTTAAFYSPQTRFWELLIGSILACSALPVEALSRRSGEQLRKGIGRKEWPKASGSDGIIMRNLCSVFGSGLIAAGLVLITKDRPFPGWWALLPTVGTVLIISAGAQSWINRTILSHRFLVWIGLISYPLYLWHWPILSFTRIVQNQVPSRWTGFTVVIVSILLAWLTNHFIEIPIRFGGYGRITAIALLGLMALIGCIGYECYAREGFPLRPLAKEAQTLSSYNYYDGKTEAEFWGGNSCFNLKDSYLSFQRNGCETALFPGNQKVFLVGDSHSAYLSQSLRGFLLEKKYNLFQFSAAYCTPLSLNDQRERCRNINRHVLEKIETEKPDLLIIFADYIDYENSPENGETIPYSDFVMERASFFRQVGVERVIIIGQIPTWEGSLPKSLIRDFILKRREVPSRTYEGIVPLSLEWDGKLRDRGHPPSGVTYLSLKDFLCDTSGCITLVGPNLEKDLIVFDSSHLTKSGSQFIVNHLLSHYIY